MTDYPTGSTVRAFYKTGAYIGEITADKGTHAVVQIKVVTKHPRQGDLHNPNQVDVPLFHERKALAFNERANIPYSQIKPYDGPLEDYYESLKNALNALTEDLTKTDSDYNKASIQALEEVKKEYRLMYNLSV